MNDLYVTNKTIYDDSDFTFPKEYKAPIFL